jgi:hypothetical protein
MPSFVSGNFDGLRYQLFEMKELTRARFSEL